MDDKRVSVDEAYEARIGRNVRDIREARRLTQTDLAARMTAQGLPFRQQTLVKIENGTRPLRLQEAHQIARLLDVELDLLVANRPGLDETARLVSKSTALQEKWDELRRASSAFEEARRDLVAAVDAADRDVANEWVLKEAQVVLKVDPVLVVADAVKERAAELDAQAARAKATKEFIASAREAE